MLEQAPEAGTWARLSARGAKPAEQAGVWKVDCQQPGAEVGAGRGAGRGDGGPTGGAEAERQRRRLAVKSSADPIACFGAGSPHLKDLALASTARSFGIAWPLRVA